MKNSEILVENSMCRIFSKLKYKIEFKETNKKFGNREKY